MRPPPNYTSDALDREAWDAVAAARLIGQYALVGVTWLAPDGDTVLGQGQYHGRIVSAEPATGIVIACEGRWAGEMLTLPPDPSWFFPAEPGRYSLKATEEVVVDPDCTARWSIRTAAP